MADDTSATILVLIRHGDAGDPLATPELDTRRPLTSRGRKQARRAGKALRHLGLVPAEVFSSRLRRAGETAAVAIETCDAAPRLVRAAALAPDADPRRIAKLLAAPSHPPRQAVVPPAPPADPPSAIAPTLPVAASAPAPAPAPVRWLVGHDPHLTRLLAHLLGAAPEALRLSKGAFAVVSLDARGPAAGAGTLVCLVPADGLKALARKQKGKRKGAK